MKPLTLALFAALLASPATAQPDLKPPMAGLSFLVGQWDGGRGQVADTGQTSKGSSTITAEAGGAALLRRDHTQLFDRAGAPAAAFDQIMLIYPEGGAVHADYFDGTHVIHYVSATIAPGRSVSFDTAPHADAPAFRLVYTLASPRTMKVSFSTASPGGAAFHPIAEGELTRGP